MTFDEICDEVIAVRFRESQRTAVKSWVNLRYQAIWAYVDWPWKRQGPVALPTTTANPTLPTDFLRPIRLYDDLGNELLWMEPNEFDTMYRYTQLQNITSRPEAFKWVDNVITVALAPGQSYDLALVYERKTSILQGGSTPAAGLLTQDNDVPIWDSQYHYILVIGATATGLKLENDPTYGPLEEEYDGLLRSMQDYYLPTASPAGHLQYGNDWDSY